MLRVGAAVTPTEQVQHGELAVGRRVAQLALVVAETLAAQRGRWKAQSIILLLARFSRKRLTASLDPSPIRLFHIVNPIRRSPAQLGQLSQLCRDLVAISGYRGVNENVVK